MSMDNPYFPNGRVAVLSTKLLSKDKFTRLAESGSLSAGVKILYEGGYGGGVVLSSPSEYEKLLERETVDLIAFIKAMTSDELATNCILLPYDYLNAKMIVKALAVGKDAEALCNGYGTITYQELFTSISGKKYGKLPEQLADALLQIDELGKKDALTPFAVDSILDKAMYSHIVRNAKRCSHKVIAEYFQVKIDMLNIISAFRCFKLGLDKDYYIKALLPCGKLELSTLTANFCATAEKTAEKYKRTPYEKLCVNCLYQLQKGNSLTISEVYADNYIKDILKPYNLHNDKITPLINYYFSKKIEIDNVRLILMCLKNNVESSVITERLKELYA